MRFIEFRPELLELFEWDEDDKKIYDISPEFFQQIPSGGYCLVHDGRIMGFGDVIQITRKTGYVYAFVSKYGKENPRILRHGKRMFRRVIEDMGLHRVVTFNLSQEQNRFCEWLGFKFECDLEKHDDKGRTYAQYAMVM